MEKTTASDDDNTAASTPQKPPSEEPFFTTVANHYAARADPVSAHLLAHLCKDYHTNQLNDQNFYIGVYQHLYSTASLRLLSGFRALLAPGWRDLELGWLNRQIEVEVEEKKERSRKAVGEVADGLMALGNEGGDGGGLATIPAGEKHRTVTAIVAATGNTQKEKKKMMQVKGFRPPSSKTETPPPISNTPNTLSLAVRKSPSLPPSKPKAQTPTSNPKEKPILNPNPRTKPSSPAPPNTTTTTITNTNNKPDPKSLPSATSIPHKGPIYPTTRSILSRPATKPYIHALCGQHFGHPAEVKRHHDGQNGRPGCWAKKGKPADRFKAWDEDGSCKVVLRDLAVVRVREGWVVTDWGGVSIEGMREGEEEDVATVGGGGGKKKRKTLASNKPKEEKREEESGKEVSSEAEGDEDEDEDEDEDNSPSDAEPATKRRKVVATEIVEEEQEEEAPAANAAARAAALGLRARK